MSKIQLFVSIMSDQGPDPDLQGDPVALASWIRIRIRIRIEIKIDGIRISTETNADPQYWCPPLLELSALQ
jgi:hypothetical protein